MLSGVEWLSRMRGDEQDVVELAALTKLRDTVTPVTSDTRNCMSNPNAR